MLNNNILWLKGFKVTDSRTLGEAEFWQQGPECQIPQTDGYQSK